MRKLLGVKTNKIFALLACFAANDYFFAANNANNAKDAKIAKILGCKNQTTFALLACFAANLYLFGRN